MSGERKASGLEQGKVIKVICVNFVHFNSLKEDWP